MRSFGDVWKKKFGSIKNMDVDFKNEPIDVGPAVTANVDTDPELYGMESK